MKSAMHKIVLTLLATAELCACSSRQKMFDKMIPAGATSVSFARESDAGIGVTFHASTDPKSYKYVDAVRRKLHETGYTLCKKSAISTWQEQPADAEHPSPKGFWIVELYATEHYGSFFVLRSVALPTDGGRAWNQGFSLAAQALPPGHQNMASIKEFCD